MSQSYSYSYYSASTSTNGGPPQRATFAERSYTDHSGTRTERMHQLPGQQPVYESSEHPPAAYRHIAAPATEPIRNRIVDVTDAEKDHKERRKDRKDRKDRPARH
ncbi:hypothetical protein GGR50DRAFT_611881 [Xylaria sp. CBS 124048]|nr:hypothetical protein GGR50DRAFT_611881 [Xylaria sp. CBS 124048]